MVSDLQKNWLKVFVKLLISKLFLKKIGLQGDQFRLGAICDTIYPSFQRFQSFEQKTKFKLEGKLFCKCGPVFVNTRLLCPYNFTLKKYNTEEEKKKISHFFTFLPFTLKLAHFAPLNGAGQIFPVNFNYPKFLDNSNMINFWLTSWVPLW